MFRTDIDIEFPEYSISLIWNRFKSYLAFHDAYELATNGSAYIMGEGYERSKISGVGIIDPLPLGNIVRNLPLASWAAAHFIPRIYVFSATSKNQATIASYGENITDARAREPHDRVKQATGATTIVNQVGRGARQEKQKIIRNLSNDLAFNYARELAANIADFWDANSSLQNNITYIGANIIGKCFLGIDHFPREYVQLIRNANDLIADGDATSDDFSTMKKNILAMSDHILGDNSKNIINAQGYAQAQIDSINDDNLNPDEKLKSSHAGAGFIVESNLSFIIMVALAHISVSPDILRELVDEIHNNMDLENPTDINNLIYLDCIYRETLRFASPTAVVPRVTSVKSTITVENKAKESTNCTLYPNSYLFFAIRPTHHDSTLWSNPEVFNPLRFLTAAKEGHLHFTGENYFPFSAGKRACPAGSKFVEYTFKSFLFEFFKRYTLTLDQPLESIPANAIHPRWKKEYFAVLNQHSNELTHKNKLQ